MNSSKIQWTDFTFNPWIGCSKVSDGCKHCYAEQTAKFRKQWGVEWGIGKPRKRTKTWRDPINWNRKSEEGLFRECQDCGSRGTIGISKQFTPQENCCNACGSTDNIGVCPRVFCASLADWLDDEVPIEWLSALLQLIHATPHLDWLLLSKRIDQLLQRIVKVQKLNLPFPFAKWLLDWFGNNIAPENVWLGTTVENQAVATDRIYELTNLPAQVRFLSCEPLLGPVSLGSWAIRLSWVICGGESGKEARPFKIDWAESLRDQCQAHGVSFFMKQLGNNADFKQFKLPKKGGDLQDLPEGLRIREFPEL